MSSPRSKRVSATSSSAIRGQAIAWMRALLAALDDIETIPVTLSDADPWIVADDLSVWQRRARRATERREAEIWWHLMQALGAAFLAAHGAFVTVRTVESGGIKIQGDARIVRQTADRQRDAVGRLLTWCIAHPAQALECSPAIFAALDLRFWGRTQSFFVGSEAGRMRNAKASTARLGGQARPERIKATKHVRACKVIRAQLEKNALRRQPLTVRSMATAIASAEHKKRGGLRYTPDHIARLGRQYKLW